jgi:hypothetical protein
MKFMSETAKAKAFELRELTADDMFPMFQIISKIGIKEFKSCFESDAVKGVIAKAAKGEDKSDIAAVGMMVGLDIAGILMANIGKAKEDIYGLLSGLSGMSRNEIAKLPMAVFVDMIVSVVKKEEFKDFFQAVTKLF